jgi:hypothetical protein
VAEKQTLPWEQQLTGWPMFAAFAPWGDQAFAATKPDLYQQIFGEHGLHPVVDPYRRYTANYDPFGYLSGSYTRPGGPTSAEQNVLNTSLFGTTAPLNTGGATNILNAGNAFTQSMTPGGSVWGAQPEGPLPYDPATASGMSYIGGKGWQEVPSGGYPQLVYDPTGQQAYYNGKAITSPGLSQLLATNPSAVGANGPYGSLTNDIFNSLGGQLPMPSAPQAPTLAPFQLPQAPNIPQFNMPAAPTLPAFNLPQAPALPAFNLPQAPALPAFNAPEAPALPQFNMPTAPTMPTWQNPDVGQLAYDTYNKFAQGQPGYTGALESALNPNIAMPGQSIFDMVAQQRAAGGPMDQYVNSASDAVQAAAERALQKQSIDLQSRFAGEGSYLSGPMLNALGELGASSNADTTNILANMRLNAAEAESGRVYQGATTQYQTEAQRNQAEAQIQAQTAQQLAQVYGSIAQSTGNAQADAMARAYQAQSSFLSSVYGSQVSGAASAYGTQGQYGASTYGSRLGALASAYGTQGQYQGQTYGALASALASAYGTQGQYAGQTYGAQAAALANAYGTQGQFASSNYGSQLGALSSTYNTGVNAATNIYGTQVGALSNAYNTGANYNQNIFGTQGSMYNNALNAFTGQQQFATSNATQRAQDLMTQYHINFQDAMMLAGAEQGNQQSALDALKTQYYQPGQNMLTAMQPFFGLPSVTSQAGGGGFDIGALLAAASAAATAGSGV